ncbi:hypothetical protein [Bacillus cereus]|uniref:Uncharacterized protein n=1 Tax=Bacillus cereus HuA4-10 TaxID=1053206 RepID=J8DP36_BACCE|nr:hypothetical protein [Bacillus cereus]EJQ78049.1 hypothetical protein IGC_03061 [Bacillus cereus HuA4-10]
MKKHLKLSRLFQNHHLLLKSSIDSGQTVTYTPMVYDLTAGYGYTAKAAGWLRTVSGGPYSFGETGSY